MSDFISFVERLEEKVANVKKEDIFDQGVYLFVITAVIKSGIREEIVEEFERILGRDKLDTFFGAGSSQWDLSGVLLHLMTRSISVSDSGTISVNKTFLAQKLTELVDAVHKGRVEYSLSFRFLNFDIQDEIVLEENVILRKVSPEMIKGKYPLNTGIMEEPAYFKEHGLNHRVEAVFIRQGTIREMNLNDSIEALEALERSISHAFLLNGAYRGSLPHVTHSVLESPFYSSPTYKGVGGDFSFQPEMLGEAEISRLQAAYAILKDEQNDKVLQRAIDRFILGKKQGWSHPNRTNQPNWDKIVDYVIAMETIFLTVNGNPNPSELTYRFCLNGASLLSRCSEVGNKNAFRALKHLYSLRSAVVHGSEDEKVLNSANKFIEIVGVEDIEHRHPVGRLILSCRKIEEWIIQLIFYLSALPVEERPYRKFSAWEEMLWNTK